MRSRFAKHRDGGPLLTILHTWHQHTPSARKSWVLCTYVDASGNQAWADYSPREIVSV